MENYLLLLEDVPRRTAEVVADHFVVGLLAAVILVLLGLLTKRFTNFSLRLAEVRVDGHWSTTLTELTADPTDQKVHEYVTLHQFLNKVWGETYVQNDRRDVYQVKGQLVATNLALIFRDKNGFNTGSIFLRVTSKELMEGYEIGVDREAKLYAKKYVWKSEPNKYRPAASDH